MSLGKMVCVFLVIQFTALGVVAQKGWGVNYIPKSICALKGSTVAMSCSYTFPSSHSVQKALWINKLAAGEEPPDLLDDPEYKGRIQYLDDKQPNDTIRLSNVTENDGRKFYFRFITVTDRYQGAVGVDLSVTGLQVEVPERVIEGDKVTLTCKTTCSLSYRPTFTWYRDGHRLFSNTDQLNLHSVRKEDAGRYHCAVLGQRYHSPEVILNIRYPPKNTSVSISPTGEIEKGSSVTLTCSSDAHPPVESYSWFKDAGASPVGSGHSYSFTFDYQSSGWYYCLTQNKHGSQKSAAMPINVKRNNGDYFIILYVAFGISLCAVAALVTIVFRMRRKRQIRKEEHDYQNFNPNVKDDTYTSLDPLSRSPEYDTLATARRQC